MSGELWYVRDRNKVTGPFTREQLVGLRSRGQLARFHQFSQDRQTWVSAATLTDVFAKSSTSDIIELLLDPDSTTTQTPPCWYHHNGKNAVGPVSEPELLDLVRRGLIRADSLVWKEGMATWTPIGQIPGLALGVPLSGAAAEPGDSGSRGAQLSPPRTSGLAVASLVLGIVWLCGIGSLLATVFGAVAINQISHSNGSLTGKGMAIAGLVLGIIGLAGGLLPFLIHRILAPS